MELTYLFRLTFIFILFSKCLQYLDVSVLGELVPRLCELIRSGVGLGTKVRFVCVCVGGYIGVYAHACGGQEYLYFSFTFWVSPTIAFHIIF